MATDLIDLAGHEQVAFCSDPDTGLRAIIALHDTSLGPGLGGTRFHPYSSTDQALADVLRLSRAMTSKNAVAGLDHGGGKAVIIGDPQPRQDPRAAAGLRPLRRVARRALRHGLRRRHLRRRHGRRRRVHPVGDRSLARARRRRATPRCSPPTASSRACARPPSTCGASRPSPGAGSAIAGVGKVGRRLIDHLLEDGAEVVVTDVDTDAVRALLRVHPRVRAVDDFDDLVREPSRRVQPQRPGGCPRRRDRRCAAGQGRLRWRQQPAGQRGRGRHGRPAAGPWHHLRPRLPRQRRRGHPGQRRAARVRHAPGPRAHRDDLRAHPRGAA